MVSSFEKWELLKDGTPVVWDIYISENLYTQLSELQDSEYIATIGGSDKIRATLELKSNTYVYVKYNEVINTPIGILQIDFVS